MTDAPLKVRFKLVREGAVAPKRATEHSVGWDIFADSAASIPAGGWVLVPSGCAIEMPPGTECQVRPRSGLALKHGLFVLNSPGTIDPDYRGEVCVILANFGGEAYEVRKGERIAQMVFAKVAAVSLEEAPTLSDTARGAGGFGSSGSV